MFPHLPMSISHPTSPQSLFRVLTRIIYLNEDVGGFDSLVRIFESVKQEVKKESLQILFVLNHHYLCKYFI